jgi:methylglutaconyl-CoA hydratase
MIRTASTPAALEAALSDPSRRNALGEAMFEALESLLAGARSGEESWSAGTGPLPPATMLLHGDGPAFCAGFDLEAALVDPAGPGQLMAQFLRRLSGVNRALRRLPAPTIAAVHGAALAGGCALLSACDFVVVAPDATLGYPVHRIGVSPAVTTPTLAAAIGFGPARALLLSGDLIDGVEAHRRGLATHLAKSAETVLDEARALAARLAEKGPLALRATKRWLNELDGSECDDRFDAAAAASIAVVGGAEATAMLEQFWRRKSLGR